MQFLLLLEFFLLLRRINNLCSLLRFHRNQLTKLAHAKNQEGSVRYLISIAMLPWLSNRATTKTMVNSGIKKRLNVKTYHGEVLCWNAALQNSTLL